MIGGLESHEHRRADVELAGIEQGDGLLDDPLFLQALDPPPAGRFG